MKGGKNILFGINLNYIKIENKLFYMKLNILF